MSRMVSVDADDMADILRRLRALETATPLFAASVTSGRVRIGGTAVLLVDSSGGVIVHGQLNGDGTITWSGTMTNNGPVNLNGDTNITGTLDVSGLVSLLSDLLVKAGAQLVVEGSIPMQVGASVLGIPGVSFAGGGGLVGNGSGAAMFGGTGVGSGAAVVATSSTASIGAGSKSVSVNGTRTTIDGGLQLANIPTKAGVTPNLYMDPVTGVISRVI